MPYINFIWKQLTEYMICTEIVIPKLQVILVWGKTAVGMHCVSRGAYGFEIEP